MLNQVRRYIDTVPRRCHPELVSGSFYIVKNYVKWLFILELNLI